MNYAYDKSIEDDLIQLQNGKNIHLTNASSGVQSLVPLVVLIDYITRHIYMQDAADVLNRTEAKREKMDRLVDLLYANIKQSSLESILPDLKEDRIVRHSGREYRFRNEVASQKFSRLVNNYLNYQQTDIYLEEPENNLFPSTQCQLVDWLDAKTNQRIHPISVFLTTHSPYVLRYMMDKSLRGKRYFFTYEDPEEEGVYKVKSLSLEEIEQIIANGVDMFYNYESYIS
jgi:predicted ATPase